MRGWALDADGDLALSAGNLVEITGRDATAQEIRTRLLFFRGQCFANLLEGIPYFQEILIKAPDLARVRSIFRSAILTVPTVTDVLTLDVSLGRDRVLTVTWTVRSVEGVVDSRDYPALTFDG